MFDLPQTSDILPGMVRVTTGPDGGPATNVSFTIHVADSQERAELRRLLRIVCALENVGQSEAIRSGLQAILDRREKDGTKV